MSKKAPTIKTRSRLPQEGQAVFYYFKVFRRWYAGHYEDGTFFGRLGFLHHTDVIRWRGRA